MKDFEDKNNQEDLDDSEKIIKDHEIEEILASGISTLTFKKSIDGKVVVTAKTFKKD